MIARILFALGLVASVSTAREIDPRIMATGGASLGRPVGDVVRINPAHHAVPPWGVVGETIVPLPIGLLDADVPSFDPDSDDFDLVAVADFLWNIPWTLQIGEPDPLSGDIALGIAYDRLTVDLKDARAAVPEESFTAGEQHSLLSIGRTLDLGRRLGVFHVTLFDLFVMDRLAVDLGDGLADVLREATPVVGGRTYRLDARGGIQTGFSTGIAYAREIPLGGDDVDPDGEDWLDRYWDGESRRPRLWVGGGVRRHFGVATVDLDSRLRLTGTDPLFGDDGSFEPALTSRLRRANTDVLGSWGGGWSVDLGAVTRWRDWQFGVGVSDLFAELTWSDGTVQRYDYDPVTDTLVDDVEAEGVEIVTPIETSWRVDASYRPHTTRTIGGSVVRTSGTTSVHVGVEEWVRPWLALRAGSERDGRGLWQGGAGVGLRRGVVGVDLAARTHARNVRGERVLEIGLALVLHPRLRGGS